MEKQLSNFSGELNASGSTANQFQYTDFIHFPVDWTSVIPVLSFGSAILILAICIKKKFYKSPFQIIVFMINLADAIYILPIVIFLTTELVSETFCKIASIPLAYGIESSVFWTAFFGHALWRTSADGNTKRLDKFLRYYFLFGTLIPFLNVLRSPFTNYFQYSDKSNNCYHRAYLSEIDLNGFIFADGFVYLASILSIVWYSLAYSNLRKRKLLNKQHQNFLLLILYPAVLLFCCLPMRALKFWILSGEQPSKTSIKTAQMLAFLQGFLNAIIYGTRSKWFQKLLSKPHCCKKQVNDYDYQNAIFYDDDAEDGEVIGSEHSFSSLIGAGQVYETSMDAKSRTLSQSEVIDKPNVNKTNCQDLERTERIYSF